MPPLSPKQRGLLEQIVRFRARQGYSPTVRQLQAALGLRSTATVHNHLVALIRKGYLSRQGPYRMLVVIERG